MDPTSLRDNTKGPEKIYKSHYLLTKEPLNIPLESTEEIKNPRLENYPSTSPSWVDSSELSELDQMLRAQLETTDTSTEERTLAIQWITLDTIGTVDNL